MTGTAFDLNPITWMQIPDFASKKIPLDTVPQILALVLSFPTDSLAPSFLPPVQAVRLIHLKFSFHPVVSSKAGSISQLPI